MTRRNQNHKPAAKKTLAAKAAPAKALAKKTAPKAKQTDIAGAKAADRKPVGKTGGRSVPSAAGQVSTRAKAAPATRVAGPKTVNTSETAGNPKTPVRPAPSRKADADDKSSASKPAPERTKAGRAAAAAPSRPAQSSSHAKPVKSAGEPQPADRPHQLPSEFDGFKVNTHVVYPTHGVGKIIAVEAQEIAGTRLELFVISFEQEKMILRVPFGKAKAVGMRILSSRDTVRNALKTLRGRARVKRTMWSRRAQEYEAKINSGNLMLIAEVVRDLYRAEGQPEQSYSERQIYEAALERLAREVGAVEELDSGAALERVEGALKKAA